ncbi:hypothetical protein [Roseobacter ponti]|uniref:Uncharacterized protein n=1 Tax=Roseobacter ponti TaxID=1891787 RepID=A0A858SQY9_9RHOB|nr:hypothetical protein [Roseobacter ponti]QJF50288.1 hypothetical protein G3256_03440 [Roseobacter ponti]
MLPPLVFFGVGLSALVATIDLLAKSDGIVPVSYVSACVGALLISKGVLLAEFLPFFDRFSSSTRLALISWKALLVFLATTCLHVLERVISAGRHASDIESGVAAELQTFSWAHFLVVQMWLAILIFSFVTVMEMARGLGHQSVLKALSDKAG